MEISVYERVYRLFHRNIVKKEYQIQLTRHRYNQIKRDPYMRDLLDDVSPNDRILQRIDLDDYDQIVYMIGVTLNSPGMKCYLVYSNGAKRRIKLCRFT